MMGAASEHRGNRAIRRQIEEEQASDPHLSCRQAISHLQAENDRVRQAVRENETLAAELTKAKGLIDRLRAENTVLKDEKRRVAATVEACKRHITVAGNASKKYAVALVKSQLEKARLL